MIIERNDKTWTELELRLLEILQENGMNEMLQPNCVEEIILEFEKLPVFKNLSKGDVIKSVCPNCNGRGGFSKEYDSPIIVTCERCDGKGQTVL